MVSSMVHMSSVPLGLHRRVLALGVEREGAK